MLSASQLLHIDDHVLEQPAAALAARVRGLIPHRLEALVHERARGASRATRHEHGGAALFVHAFETTLGEAVEPERSVREDVDAMRARHEGVRPDVVVTFRLVDDGDEALHAAHDARWRRACAAEGVAQALTFPIAGRRSLRDVAFSWAHGHDEPVTGDHPTANDLYAALVALRPSVHPHELEVFDELLRLADATVRKSTFDGFDASVLCATVAALAAHVPGRLVVQVVGRRISESLLATARVALGAKAFVESMVSNGRARSLRAVFYAPKGLAFEARRSLAMAPLEPRVRYEAKAAMLASMRCAEQCEGVRLEGHALDPLHVGAATAESFTRWFGLRPSSVGAGPCPTEAGGA